MENNLSAFGFIDYKKPQKGDDYRTSSYMGHRYITDNMRYAKMNNTSSKEYLDDPVLVKTRVSEYKHEFQQLPNDPGKPSNPKLDMKHQFMKPLEDVKYKFLPRPMHPPKSITHQEFIWQPQQEELPIKAIPMRKNIPVTPQVIDYNDHGTSKYLDPNATTNRLTYVYRSPQKLMSGVGAHDNITFWNWKKLYSKTIPVYPVKDKHMCDDAPADQCKKSKKSGECTIKFVPNRCMTTEVRENYKGQMELFHLPKPRKPATYPEFKRMPISTKTFNGIYGTGSCTQRYI